MHVLGRGFVQASAEDFRAGERDEKIRLQRFLLLSRWKGKAEACCAAQYLMSSEEVHNISIFIAEGMMKIAKPESLSLLIDST